MRTPNREPQEYSRNIQVLGIYLPGPYIPAIFLLYCGGSLFGVPITVLWLFDGFLIILVNSPNQKWTRP